MWAKLLVISCEEEMRTVHNNKKNIYDFSSNSVVQTYYPSDFNNKLFI